jgi:ribonucleoside-diphosphate reductase alpha chain
MERAYNFAKANRALGLGVLGYHSLLQSKMIPFESQEARDINNEVFAVIRRGAEAASRFMATELGEPEVMKGYGMRNATLMAIAPTTSSAFILGQVSQGIEPVWSNCYIKDVAKAKVVIKNNQLLELLEQKGENTKETWHSIRDHDGSVQHLNCLSENEKAVFKTFGEINQEEIIDQAGDRQQFIDQGQSLNIKAHPNVSAKEMNILALKAWDSGIKALYYQHSDNVAQSMVRERQAKK